MISRLFATKPRRVSRRTSAPEERGAVTSAPLLRKESSVPGIERYDHCQRGGIVRREVTAFARQNGDIDIFPGGNLAHEARKPAV